MSARPYSRRLPPTLIVLTAGTGFIDAVSYLGLGRVFTANMTGNVVLLGFGLAGAAGLPILAPLLSLLAFMVGSRAGGALADRLAERHHRHVLVALFGESVLVVVAAIVAAAATVRAGNAVAAVVIVILALAMGLRNATVRRFGVPDLSTTVLTMTITGLAADKPSTPEDHRRWLRRGAAIAAMLIGALLGALLEKHELIAPLAIAAALSASTALTYTTLEARDV